MHSKEFTQKNDHSAITGEHKDPANVISPKDEFITLHCHLFAQNNDSYAFLDLYFCALCLLAVFFWFLVPLTEIKESTKQREIQQKRKQICEQAVGSMHMIDRVPVTVPVQCISIHFLHSLRNLRMCDSLKIYRCF